MARDRPLPDFGQGYEVTRQTGCLHMPTIPYLTHYLTNRLYRFQVNQLSKCVVVLPTRYHYGTVMTVEQDYEWHSGWLLIRPKSDGLASVGGVMVPATFQI